MDNFADRLVKKSIANKSVLCAGLDPIIEKLPRFIFDELSKKVSSDDELVYQVLTRTYFPALEVLRDSVAACKPNIAFFEQYGVAGVKAFAEILKKMRELGILVISDAKRGDIGSTADAYASAFLGSSKIGNKSLTAFDSDALTVNPFLGKDTLESFVKACKDHGKGLYVLVKTSNPESGWIQSVVDSSGETISEKVAKWVSERGSELIGNSGISSLGAVVGATYPEQARALRKLMPQSIFLIPGYGAQGGNALEATAGFAQSSNSKPSIASSAAVVNVSRGLFGVFSENFSNIEQMQLALKSRVKELNSDINSQLD
jgi:orotidine-5'-phosphate decarboxylase